MAVEPISLGGLTPSQFLTEYWQKKPLLIRQGLPDYASPITPDELAGLACEAGVESRLVLEKDGEKPWELRHGPFEETVFAQLPATHWTLLVQAVDRQVPEVADLIDKFSFVPSWRIDDVMISYAPPAGSVGPHTDSYDVFLIQVEGRRRWDISLAVKPALLPEVDLRILAEFEPEQSWILEPGDILYLPPGVAHHGVALTDSLTFSIGFLAPGHTELLSSYLEEALSQRDHEQRYADPDLHPQLHPGELSAAALQKIQHLFDTLPLDQHSISQWFGRYISESRPAALHQPCEPPLTPRDWLRAFQTQGYLRRDARLLFLREGASTTLFVEGQDYPLDADLAFAAPLLSGQRDFSHAELSAYLLHPPFLALLTTLTNQGFFYFYEN